MSDKIFMKDITLPIVETGENETYSFVQTDADLDTAGDAADAKAVGDELTNLKQELNQFPNGNYPNMTVGSAEQLLSTVFVEDETPYNFRTSGGSADIGDREYDEIVGVSMPINQFFPNDVMHVTGTFAPNWSVISSQSFNFSVISGHKYLFTLNGKTVSDGGLGVRDVTQEIVFRPTPLSYAIIFGATITSNGTTFVQGKWDEGTTDAYLNAFDLTLMLGTAIADYVYGLETATAGSGVTWLKHHFPKIFDSGYIPYNAGEMQSVSGLSSHRMTGFNQWDETWEAGTYNHTNGQKMTGSLPSIRSKGFIKCLPGTTYCIGYTGSISGMKFRVCTYDADQNFISGFNDIPANTDITTPDGAYYLAFGTIGVTISTYSNDICINLHWDGERDGQYEEYKEYEYALDDSVVLRGILKLDSSNSLYADGDRYLPDGTLDRRYGIYTFTGNEQWGQYTSWSSEHTWKTNIVQAGIPNTADTTTCLSSVYPTSTFSDVLSGNGVGIILRGDYGDLYVSDPALTSSADCQSKFKAGTTVIFLLNNATTETAEPYQTPQIVDDWGTEEYVSTSLVPVGHDTKYANNLRAKLEMSPDSPEEDGDYIVRHNNGENQYVALGSTTTIQGILDRLTALENA